MNRAHFIHLFAYDAWANTRTRQSVSDHPTPRALEIMSHIAETEYLWYMRIRGDYAHVSSVWNRWPLDRLEKEVELLSITWTAWLDGLSEEDLEREVTYRNTSGVEYTNTIRQILTHVINHSTYHRGQIAAEVRRAGGTPALTDYVAYFR